MFGRKQKYTLVPGKLTLAEIKQLQSETRQVVLDESCLQKIKTSATLVADTVAQEKTTYGINTGFGILANENISHEKLKTLQNNLLLSHAAGTGELLSDDVVKIILLLKVNSLAQGYSGVRQQTIDALIALYNAEVYPCVPAKGSVGASGDLAPLAHLSLILIGEGEARYKNNIVSAKKALRKAGIKPLELAPKEGLALVNGTQVSTALAVQALLEIETVFDAAIITGALSVEAARASHVPFSKGIHLLRGQAGQIECAERMRKLLFESEINKAHANCDKIQDPYSLRCQPQVMGACLDQITHARDVLAIEVNAVTDNPLVFPEEYVIRTGGNFHAEPVAMVADNLALAIAEIGSITERRIALLVNKNHSRLPAFLVSDSGVNSGFMIAQVTASALASENKQLATPASVDSIPTSANQEDHVSMATYAARRLFTMAENTKTIVAIELLAACQGLEFLLPNKTSKPLQEVIKKVREEIPAYEQDRYMAPDIEAAKKLLESITSQS